MKLYSWASNLRIRRIDTGGVIGHLQVGDSIEAKEVLDTHEFINKYNAYWAQNITCDRWAVTTYDGKQCAVCAKVPTKVYLREEKPSTAGGGGGGGEENEWTWPEASTGAGLSGMQLFGLAAMAAGAIVLVYFLTRGKERRPSREALSQGR